MALSRKVTRKIYEIQAHSLKVTSLDLGQTGRVLVTGGQDRNVNLWAFGNEKCFMSLTGHNSFVDCVKFAYNDDFVYSADESGIIKRWDLNASTDCSTFYGHMKTVRTLDFHPYGEYIASGSNDTTVRLWDIKNNSCIKKYRGHIANVNSVKFSPDGSWIASAGTEGSVIIWDIRMSKQIIEFPEHASPVTCIQFHPFEFLLAVGRNDGTIDFYDLESKQLISRTDRSKPFSGQTVKCLTFSDNGDCLFVGTTEGVSVIGWEPDREFDHIESTWNLLGDMKIVNNQLICGAFENTTVAIHQLGMNQIIPFYNPSNKPFSHSQSSRKSFSNRTGKLRLSIGNKSNGKEPVDSNHSNDGGASSPNLSFEMIDEEETKVSLTNGFKFETTSKLSLDNLPIVPDKFQLSRFLNHNSLTMSDESEAYKLDNNYTSDLDAYPTKSSLILNKVIEPEREDFPVNNAQPPDYAPKSLNLSKSVVARHKADMEIRRKPSPPILTSRMGNKRLTASQSTTDLNKLDELNNTFVVKRPQSRNGSPTRNYHANNLNGKFKRNETTAQLNKENNLNKSRNIPVHIMTKPVRSKTAIDIKSNSTGVGPTTQHTPKIMNYASDLANESHEMQLMATCHESVYQSLCNRHATLQLIRNSTRTHDLMGALRCAIKMSDHSVLVDLLGAILEKTASWNLDMCVLLLPEIYELFQGEYKFHYMRACDTLRVILSSFLPIIQANCDPWTLGVDVTREERQRKCLECKQWLLRIRGLPENKKMGTALQQLQNLIVDI